MAHEIRSNLCTNKEQVHHLCVVARTEANRLPVGISQGVRDGILQDRQTVKPPGMTGQMLGVKGPRVNDGSIRRTLATMSRANHQCEFDSRSCDCIGRLTVNPLRLIKIC